MSTRNRMTTAFLVGTAAAVLMLALPVEAQVPGTTPAIQPQDTVNLTMEQRHVIKEIILKDLASARDEATPPEYKELVDRYYEVLSKGGGRSEAVRD